MADFPENPMIRTLIVLAALFMAIPAWATTVAIVDFERAVNETTEGKAAQARLDTMLSSRRGELEKLQTDYQKMVEDYQARALILSEGARADAEREVMRKQQELTQKSMQYEQEMQQTYLTLLSDLDEKMRTMTTEIAAEKGYDVVLNKAATVYAGPGLIDMTDDLIKRYNNK